MFANGLYALVAGFAPIAATVGARIYPVKLPESPTYPAMTYQIVAQTGSPTQQTAGLQRVRVQFDCFGSALAPSGADGYTDAALLDDALRQLLDGFVGWLADGTVVQNSTRIQRVDYFDDDARVYRCMSEYYLWFAYAD